MKKFVLFLAVALMLSAAYAGAEVVQKMDSTKALTKFSRGITNVATSPGEFVNQVPPAMEQSPDYLTGTIALAFRGIGYSLLRVGAGIYDIATFPFPGPTNYGSIMKQETIVGQVVDTTMQQNLPTV